MNDYKNPCSEGLTFDCFAAMPRWARTAFAYRLLCVFCPPALSRRLQRYFRYAQLTPGYEFPAGWTPGDPLPPGVTIPPGFEFPPGWTPDDPLPPGVLFPPGAEVPPDFVLPPGVTIPPGFEFPPGWTPDDPLPPGLLPPGVDWDDPPAPAPSPPPIIAPWVPGRPHVSPTAPKGWTSASFYTNTGDGYVANTDDGWLTTRNAETGDDVSDSEDWRSSCMTAAVIVPPIYAIARTFFYFDLSTIPAGDVLSASLFVKGFNNADSHVCVQEGTQGSPLAMSDFNSFAGNYFCAQQWIVGDNNLEFNSAGIAYIKSVLGGWAKLCLREYTHDYLGTSPAGVFSNGCYFVEYADQATWAQLTIFYK